MDEHVARSITLARRQRGVDVMTAREDGRFGASDAALLDLGSGPVRRQVAA
jgi:hypothetical protein